MPKTFTCSMCGCTGECQPEEDALAELAEEFGDDINPDDCDVVCDDCWEKVRPKNNKEWFDTWKKSVKPPLGLIHGDN